MKVPSTEVSLEGIRQQEKKCVRGKLWCQFDFIIYECVPDKEGKRKAKKSFSFTHMCVCACYIFNSLIFSLLLAETQ